jgi:hypothetical protein
MEMERQMGITNERIHWILLVSGSILADAGEGEKPLIPNSLMHLSGMQVKLKLLLDNFCCNDFLSDYEALHFAWVGFGR